MEQQPIKRGDLGGPTVRTIRLSERAADALRRLMAGSDIPGTRQRRIDSYIFMNRLIVRYAAGEYLAYHPDFEELRVSLEATQPGWEGNPRLERAASVLLGWLNTQRIARGLYSGQ